MTVSCHRLSRLPFITAVRDCTSVATIKFCLLGAVAQVLSSRANELHVTRGHHTLVRLLDFVLARMKILAGRSGVINSTLNLLISFCLSVCVHSLLEGLE